MRLPTNPLPLGRHAATPTRRARGWTSSRRARGITLIELMVVLVIIGVLAALIVPNVLDRTDDARATDRKSVV